MLTYFDMQTRARHFEIRASHRPADIDEHQLLTLEGSGEPNHRQTALDEQQLLALGRKENPRKEKAEDGAADWFGLIFFIFGGGGGGC